MRFAARFVSVPGTITLAVLVLVRGATIGVRALWLVTVVLGLSLAMFSRGTTAATPT